MKRLIVIAAAFAVVATACAERGAHVLGSAPTGPSATTAAAASEPKPNIHFSTDERRRSAASA